MFIEMFSKAKRAAKIKKAADAYNQRLLDDKDFALKESSEPYSAYIQEWFPKTTTPIKVLELGCGPGRYISILQHFNCHIVGVDPCYFDTWDSYKECSNVTLQDKIKAENLPFADESFDFVVCLSALLYFDDPDKAFQEIYRVLKPKGRLALRTVNVKNLYTSFTGKRLDPASKKLYLKEELVSLLGKHKFLIKKYFSYGFYSPIFPNYYWYIHNVFLSFNMQKKLSSLVPESRGLSHHFFAEKPGS